MKMTVEQTIISHFGKNVIQSEINEMEELISNNKNRILNVFRREMNNVFGDEADSIHIDAKYTTTEQLYKIDVQRKRGNKETIGPAFISEAVKNEIDYARDVDTALNDLCRELVNSLRSSMEEIMTTQTHANAGTSKKYIIRTDDGR